MNAETISTLNFVVHSLVIGAAAWLLVRLVIRDALQRCILANLAVLMCLYTPFNIGMQDLMPPPKEEVPVWTPIRETFKADWRVSVAPAKVVAVDAAPHVRSCDVDEVVRGLRWLVWTVAAALLMRLLYQSVSVQIWAWRLREPTQSEMSVLPEGLPHERISVFAGEGTPCVAGWLFPVIAVPASAFETLTRREWGWLLRHEAEHLRLHDTVAALLQSIVRALLWWNPFVHALMEEYARAREEMCDAAAVGKEREPAAYADFLLAWAAKPGPQQVCVMPMAYSRPARRLKARLVALMEARGVRKKMGALFVLVLAAFAVIAPVVASSFGIAAAAAQEPVKDDVAMKTRVEKVAPDFLNGETALDPNGGKADSFSTTLRVAPPASEGRDVPEAKGAEKKTAELPRSVYRVPGGFGDGKKPVEYLEGKGVVFPEGASAELADGTLTVQNTRKNLDLIEQLLLKSMTAGGDKGVSIKVDVHVAEVEDGKALGEWNPEKSTWIREPGAAPVSIRQAPPEVRHVFSAAGVMTSAQLQTLLGGIKGMAGVSLDALPGKGMKHDKRTVFEVPATLGGGQLAVRPQITSSSGSLSLNLQLPDLIPAPKRLMTTQVEIWDGQTVVLSGIPSEKEKVFRVIFVTARLVYPAEEVKK